MSIADQSYPLNTELSDFAAPAPTQFDKQISSGTTTSSPIFLFKKIFFTATFQ